MYHKRGLGDEEWPEQRFYPGETDDDLPPNRHKNSAGQRFMDAATAAGQAILPIFWFVPPEYATSDPAESLTEAQEAMVRDFVRDLEQL